MNRLARAADDVATTTSPSSRSTRRDDLAQHGCEVAVAEQVGVVDADREVGVAAPSRTSASPSPGLEDDWPAAATTCTPVTWAAEADA